MAKTKDVWVKGKIAAQALGCSIAHLNHLRQDGLLKKRIHFKNIGRKLAMRPTYRYHLPNLLRDF